MVETYHIYTQPDCVFCLKAKELLDSLNLPYEEHDISDPKSPHGRFFRLKGYNKVPQCYEGSKHIGSYTQLDAHLVGKIASYDL